MTSINRFVRDGDPALSVQISPDAKTTDLADAFVITTPAQNWAWALLCSFQLADRRDAVLVGTRIILDVELSSGAIGIALFDSDPFRPISIEEVVGSGDRHAITVEVDSRATGFCVRSADQGASFLKIFGICVVPRYRYHAGRVIHQVMPNLLRQGPQALQAISQALSVESGSFVSPDEIGALDTSGVSFPIVLPPVHQVFNDEIGEMAVREAERIAAMADTFRQTEAHRSHLRTFSPEFLRAYCRQTIIRVYYLAHVLRALGLMSGTVLEIGSLMGNFAATLRCLGYDVTAVDRYESYDGALDQYVAYLRNLGVEVVSTTRESEEAVIAGLGKYDAVISMAVIEHIPHTPRFFLNMLASHVKEGGILALDTPNIARYWNRLALAEGRSVHQEIATQFNSELPYEGHHREYTADELVWMMEQVGCSGLVTERFDYNVLQFDRLERAHAEALLRMTIDPTQTDTILVAGRL